MRCRVDCEHQSPVNGWLPAKFRISDGEEEKFEYGLVVWKRTACSECLSELRVEGFDGVRRVENLVDVCGIGKERNEFIPFGRWTAQVCMTAFGKVAAMDLSRPVRPSAQTKKTSSPRPCPPAHRSGAPSDRRSAPTSAPDGPGGRGNGRGPGPGRWPMVDGASS